MSVVLVTNRRASARWQGYHGIELAPARLFGIMPGARPLRLVAVVALLCAAVVVAVGLGRPAGEGSHARGTVGACLRPSRGLSEVGRPGCGWKGEPPAGGRWWS